MYFFDKIKLIQYRNYLQSEYQFTERIIGIYGMNGTGKTNLLDAIYTLCFTKSYFSKPEANNVLHGAYGYRIDGKIVGEKEYELSCIVRENLKKEFLLNHEAYKKFSEHIGLFTCVIISPDDLEIINGGAELRRKFIDTILSQTEPHYLQSLIKYNKILQQRNSLLKQLHFNSNEDLSLVDILDQQLIEEGNTIHAIRKIFFKEFIPLVQKNYFEISEKEYAIHLKYNHQFNTIEFKKLLTEYRKKDILSQRSNVGIHKDDIEVILNEKSFKSIASQGQKKTLLFALKLAEYEYLKIKKGFYPILLLDDVFEKLDSDRMQNLLEKVCHQEYGQVFITDTHKERLESAFQKLNIPFQLVEIK